MPISCIYKVLSLEMRPLCMSWCPQQMGKDKNEVLCSPWEIWCLSPKAFFLAGGALTLSTSPGICYLPAGLMEQQLGSSTQPQQPCLIPTPRNGQYIATRLPPIPQKPRTSPSTDGDRILMGEACLKQGSVALNCIPQCVWLWANSWCPGPCKVPYKVLQTNGLV